MNYVHGRLFIRDFSYDTDLDDVLNLDIKDLDALELLNMSGMTPREYMEWHLDELGDKTKVIFYDEKLVGILGIDSEDDILWFTTIKLNRKEEFSLVRQFNEVLELLMKEVNVKSTYCYVDATYNDSVNWAINGGFIIESDVFFNGNKFHLMKYAINKHNDKLSLR